MGVGGRSRVDWRRVLPWLVSAAALFYVFGWATDWSALVEATEGADLPLFVAITVADKLMFFTGWTLLQAAAIRRFVTPVPVAEVVAVRGGSELLRAVSNPLADAGFFLGLAQLTRGRLEAVLAAALIPFITHLIVLLCQATLALVFLSGGPGAHRDVTLVAVLGWTFVGSLALGMRLAPSASRAIPGVSRVIRLLDRISVARLLPFCGWFALLAALDVFIQGLASRAFGLEIAWSALLGRIPILYIALSIPSFGNFGTRELTWAALFSEYGSRSSLIAFAFATNGLFLLLNVLIGVVFLPRAITLLTEFRRARRQGLEIPEPLLHDASDP
jgi:hypothetical protein